MKYLLLIALAACTPANLHTRSEYYDACVGIVKRDTPKDDPFYICTPAAVNACNTYGCKE